MKLDDYIDQESLEIMKLSMRLELSQAELESVRYLSDLFRTLEKHYDNSEVLLARFMYTLKILGHGRYGERAIRGLESLQQKLNPFSLDKDLKRGVDFDNFCLHQHLALACSMVPKEGNKCVIRQFARMINVNPSTVSTPCEIVTKLIESRKITVKNQLDLVEEVFIKSKLFSEDQLRKYRENCELISKDESNCVCYAFICMTSLNGPYCVCIQIVVSGLHHVAVQLRPWIVQGQ